jgi:hypothetical protein
VLHEVDEQRERLGLEKHGAAGPPQLGALQIQLEVAEADGCAALQRPRHWPPLAPRAAPPQRHSGRPDYLTGTTFRAAQKSKRASASRRRRTPPTQVKGSQEILRTSSVPSRITLFRRASAQLGIILGSRNNERGGMLQ